MQIFLKVTIFPLLFLLIILAGCQPGRPSYNHYTSPEITGRVLSADTHQPIANVQVQRAGANDDFEPFGPTKGGQLLMQPRPVLTDADGHFVLGSKSVFALFRSPGWWTAPVSFRHSGYESFSTNYTGDNVTSHTHAGAPVVNAGDILLQPLVK